MHHIKTKYIELYDPKTNELILECSVRNGRQNIKWFKDSDCIENNRCRFDESIGGIKRLCIKNPVSNDFGCYTCHAEDGQQIDEIYKNVNDLNFMIRSEYLNGDQNYSECKAHIVNKEPLLGKKLHTNDNNYLQETEQSDRSHDNHINKMLHRDAKRKPIFSTELMDRTVTENSSIKLTCNILGIDIKIQWLKNGQPVNLTSRYRQEFTKGLATLEIFTVLPEDNGEYTCVARNNYGEQSSSSNLKVIPGYEKSPMPPIFTRSMKGNINKLKFFFKTTTSTTTTTTKE